ncbi:MAG: hypothetical protein RML40_12365, partial [Bacteroidota bacterium]|nr:hypothetical protein [Bacteroidota bacterium]
MLIEPIRGVFRPYMHLVTSGLPDVVNSASEPSSYLITQQLTAAMTDTGSTLPFPLMQAQYSPFPRLYYVIAHVVLHNNTGSTQTINVNIRALKENG